LDSLAKATTSQAMQILGWPAELVDVLCAEVSQ